VDCTFKWSNRWRLSAFEMPAGAAKPVNFTGFIVDTTAQPRLRLW
jgi:hypothetical protein